MIFLVKGRSNVGKSGFSQALAEKLRVTPPKWPIGEEELAEWQEVLEGWPVGEPGFITDTRHVDVDKVCAIVLFRHRAEMPPPPQREEGVSYEEYQLWRDKTALDTLKPPLFDEVFSIICEMIETMDHPIVDGTAMGTSQRDSRLARMIRFKYSQQPILRILLKRTIHESAAFEGKNLGTAEVNGRDFTFAEVLERIERRPDGGIELAPELRSAATRVA